VKNKQEYYIEYYTLKHCTELMKESSRKYQ